MNFYVCFFLFSLIVIIYDKKSHFIQTFIKLVQENVIKLTRGLLNKDIPELV